MPAMTTPDASPARPPVSADDPRRLGLADLAGRLIGGLAALARTYEAAAQHAHGALQQALGELARAKASQVAVLAPLARSLGVVGGPPPAPVPVPETPPAWGVILGEAFQAERTMEWGSRELAVLAEDPTIQALAILLATGLGRDLGEVRKLYLRYT